MKKLVSMGTLVLLGLAVPIAAFAASATPPPIKALEKQGFQIEDQFDTPGDLTGYAAQYKGQPITVYLTPDKKRALVGTMVDGQGHNLSAEPLQKMSAQQHQDIWPKLEQSHWVADGSDDAKRVVYEFTDANCPFCHKFWQASRPWVKAGKVQIREVMVGILKSSSKPKAAAILAADDPAAALKKNEQNYDNGGITPVKNIPADVKKKIEANNKLMKSQGFYATPTIVYRDDNGQVQVKQGLPQGDSLTKIMGSPEP